MYGLRSQGVSVLQRIFRFVQSPCFTPSLALYPVLRRRAAAGFAALVCLLLAFAVASHAAVHQGATGAGAGIGLSGLGEVPADLHTDDHFGKRRRASLHRVQAEPSPADRATGGHAFVAAASMAFALRNAPAPGLRPGSADAQRADPAWRLRRSRGPPLCA